LNSSPGLIGQLSGGLGSIGGRAWSVVTQQSFSTEQSQIVTSARAFRAEATGDNKRNRC
jgi:hypothetical protein